MGRDSTMVNVAETNKGQKLITIPKALAELYNIRKGDKLQWKQEHGRLFIEKVE